MNDNNQLVEDKIAEAVESLTPIAATKTGEDVVHFFFVDTGNGEDFVVVHDNIDLDGLSRLITAEISYAMLSDDERAKMTPDAQLAKIQLRLADMNDTGAVRMSEAAKRIIIGVFDRGWVSLDAKSYSAARPLVQKAGIKFGSDERVNKLLVMFNHYFPKLVKIDGKAVYNPYRQIFVEFLTFAATYEDGAEFKPE